MPPSFKRVAMTIQFGIIRNAEILFGDFVSFPLITLGSGFHAKPHF